MSIPVAPFFKDPNAEPNVGPWLLGFNTCELCDDEAVGWLWDEQGVLWLPVCAGHEPT